VTTLDGVSSLQSFDLDSPAAPAPNLLVFPPYWFPEDASHQNWILAVDGIASRPGSDSKLTTRWSISMMGKLMRARPQELKEPIFLTRLAPFLSTGIKNLTVEIRVGIRRFYLRRRTNRSGAFRGRLRFSAAELCRLLDLKLAEGVQPAAVLRDLRERLPIAVAVYPEVASPQVCFAMRIDWQGWSVISDIDDTIKDSQVSPLRQLLANTFLRQFRGVSGMSDLYRDWAAMGCQFHYVSSSPWQLFAPLQELCDIEQFPAGTFHLRTFRLGADLLRKMLLFRQRGKAIVIRSLLATFPQRRFLLIGDSGERDPEIYCRLARRFPGQVQAIYIREVQARRMTRQRLKKLADRLPNGLCRIFTEADELARLSQVHLAGGKPEGETS